MKVEIFTPVSYYGPVEARTWPTPPRRSTTRRHGMRSMEHGFEQCEAALKARLRLAELRRAPLLDRTS